MNWNVTDDISEKRYPMFKKTCKSSDKNDFYQTWRAGREKDTK